MASLNPDDPDDSGDPPRTPRLVKKDEVSDLPPDSEDNVAHQTEGVFRNFAFHMYANETNRPEDCDTPRMTELTTFTDEPLGQTATVGRQLAMIGDDINVRYAPEFNQLIKVLNISPETAYEAFAGVARKLFHDGNISWGRILTLLCFGYRIAAKVIQDGIVGFFSRIVGFVCRFIARERIAQWIAQQGGWIAALQYIPETVGWPSLGIIASVAFVSIVFAIYMARR